MNVSVMEEVVTEASGGGGADGEGEGRGRRGEEGGRERRQCAAWRMSSESITLESGWIALPQRDASSRIQEARQPRMIG